MWNVAESGWSEGDTQWPDAGAGAAGGIECYVGLGSVYCFLEINEPGNSDAVWPSLPMPSTTAQGGGYG